MKKTILQIFLAIVVIGLAYWLYDEIMSPVRFKNSKDARDKAVIERIIDIRSAERAYKQVNQVYTGSFDTLIAFVLNGDMQFERQLYSTDDSVAMARLKKAKKKNVETFTVKAIDTVFGAKKLTPKQVEQLRYIPFSADDNGTKKEFILGAGKVKVGNVDVPVFEARAPYKAYLFDLNRQELINLIDERENVLNKYPGIKVGDLNQATNDAGNWE